MFSANSNKKICNLKQNTGHRSRNLPSAAETHILVLGTDQLHVYCEADLRLLFSHMYAKSRFYHNAAQLQVTSVGR